MVNTKKLFKTALEGVVSSSLVAGYRYDRKSGVTKFYCNPAKGYKVDKIEKDSKGIVRYVSFKLV